MKNSKGVIIDTVSTTEGVIFLLETAGVTVKLEQQAVFHLGQLGGQLC